MRRPFLLLISIATLAASEPLRVCATVTDLGSLVRAVGGHDVAVTVFARGGDDPHFVEARPSFTKALSLADCLVETGLELEIGWLPQVVQQARNARVQSGTPGRIDAATAITPIGVPAAGTDRAAGDVHAGGNPHYLLDPLNGLAVARLLRDRFAALRPAAAGRFAANHQAFAERLASALVGDALARQLGGEAACAHAAAGTLAEAAGATAVGGWLARLPPGRRLTVVADHDRWPYFAGRFGLDVVAILEPKPGVPPTTRHLVEVMTRMQALGAKTVLVAPYFDPRHARLVCERTGARVAAMGHQCGSLPGTDDYLALIDHNVLAVAQAAAAP